MPLVTQLTFRCDYFGTTSHRPDLGGIEGKPARLRLRQDPGKVAVDRRARRGVLLKPLQLGMKSITFRLPAQHGPGEQTFSPQCDESLGIQILWVKGPDAHGRQPIVLSGVAAASPTTVVQGRTDQPLTRPART